jgi:opacity protein-like surface antigen
MKKVILSLVAVMAFGFANAQNIKFGAKAGLYISKFTGDAKKSDSKVGFQVGAFGEFKISEKFAIQPELLFSNLGAKETVIGIKRTYNFNYIVVPVMAKYYVANKFALEAGPQIGFLTSAKLKVDGQTRDIKELFNSTDFGLNIGAGYDVAEKINIGLRYTIGLSNIEKDSGDSKSGNGNFALAVGYKF